MNILVVSVASAVALVTLVTQPRLGIALIFLVRPFVDTTWDTEVALGLKLTEIFSAGVAVIVLAQMVVRTSESALSNMPLRVPWILWASDVFLFSSIIMFDSGLNDGAQVLMRHLNGFAGFYMVQALFHRDGDSAKFGWLLILASVFPIGMGVIEGVTGHHWRVTIGEGGVVRNTGLYHDVITIRYYALQGLMGVLLACHGNRGLPRLLMYALVPYAAAALFVVKGAYSKSGVLIVGAWALMWPLITGQLKWLVGFVAGAFVAAAYYSKEIMESVGFIFAKELAVVEGSGSVQHTFAGRWYIWDEAFASWSEQSALAKLFGSGHEGLGLHNDFLQVLVHGGIVGLAIYLSLLACMAVRIVGMLKYRRDYLSAACAMLLLMWLVDAIGLVPSAYSGYQWFVWGTMAMCMRAWAGSKTDDGTVAPPAVLPRLSNLMA